MLAHLLCTLQLHLPLPRNQLQFRKWPLQWFLQHPWHTPKADLHSRLLVLFLRNLIPATSYWRNMNTRIHTNEIWEFRCRCRQSNLCKKYPPNESHNVYHPQQPRAAEIRNSEAGREVEDLTVSHPGVAENLSRRRLTIAAAERGG